jgi:hypothetical protein
VRLCKQAVDLLLVITRMVVATAAAHHPQLANEGSAAAAVMLLEDSAGSSSCAGWVCRLQRQQQLACNAAGCALWVVFLITRVTC